MPETLPDGTDHVLPGAMNAATGDRSDAASGSARDQIRSATADLRDKAQSKADELRAQVGDKARDYAEQGKARASDALHEVARLLGENATQIDDKIGRQYGDYARRAADYVTGTAETIRDKDVDDLIEEARALVRKSPGLAVGAAATAGFLLARIIKSGSEALEASAISANAATQSGNAARKAGKRKSSDNDAL